MLAARIAWSRCTPLDYGVARRRRTRSRGRPKEEVLSSRRTREAGARVLGNGLSRCWGLQWLEDIKKIVFHLSAVRICWLASLLDYYNILKIA